MAIESPFSPLIDTKEAAELVGLPYPIMLGLRRKGQGPKCERAGRKYMYDINAVIAWRKERWAVPDTTPKV